MIALKRFGIFLGILLVAYISIVEWIDLFPPKAPIDLTFVPSPDGKGYLVTAHNTSGRHVWTFARIRKSNSSEGLDAGLSLQASETKQVVWRGIKVESGDLIVLGDRLHAARFFLVP